MNKIGILINEVTPNQQYTCINRCLNNLFQIDGGVDSIVFYNHYGLCPYTHEYAIMPSVEALDYEGILIACDLIGASILQNSVSPKKYLYIWNIDWYLQPRPIDLVNKIYLNNNVDLIARSEDHADLISRVLKKPTRIIEDFNHEQISRLVHS